MTTAVQALKELKDKHKLTLGEIQLSNRVMFRSLPDLSEATQEDAAQIEFSFMGWHQLKKQSKILASMHLEWLFYYYCIDVDGNQIRGEWTKLYKRLGICKETAISYRETARVLNEHPQIVKALLDPAQDEKLHISNKRWEQLLSTDDDGQPLLLGEPYAHLSPAELRLKVQQNEQLIKEASQEIDSLKSRNDKVAQERDEWRDKFHQVRDMGESFTNGLSRVAHGIKELQDEIERLKKKNKLEDNLDVIRSIYSDLLGQIQRIGKAANILAVKDEPPAPEINPDELTAFQSHLSKSGL